MFRLNVSRRHSELSRSLWSCRIREAIVYEIGKNEDAFVFAFVELNEWAVVSSAAVMAKKARACSI